MLVYRLECSCCHRGWYSMPTASAIRPSGTTRNNFCPVWEEDCGEVVKVPLTYRRFAFKRLCDLYAWFNRWPKFGDYRTSKLTLAIYDASVVWHAEHQVQFDVRFAQRIEAYATRKEQANEDV